MKSSWILTISAALVVWTSLCAVQAAEKAGAALAIVHAPVSWAIKGQPLTLRARVTGGAGGVESVTLYYALFRDAAPFRVAMTSSGMDMYVGTIEAGLLSGLTSISYYIEAQDRDGSIEETKWHDVTFRDPDAAAIPPSRPGSGAPGKASSTAEQDKEGMSAMTIGLIAGGAVALGAGAYYLASDSGSSSGGGGGDNGGPDTNIAARAGTYTGNATVCQTIGENPITCETRVASIVIDANGRVFSNTLVPGQTLSGTMSGSSFVLSGPVNDPAQNITGNIQFNGSVVDANRIVGTISGAINQEGTPGNYSGTFNLSK